MLLKSLLTIPKRLCICGGKGLLFEAISLISINAIMSIKGRHSDFQIVTHKEVLVFQALYLQHSLRETLFASTNFSSFLPTV